MLLLIRNIVALLMLGVLLTTQAVAAPATMTHACSTMMASQPPAVSVQPSAGHDMAAMAQDNGQMMMADHCNQGHEDRCSADHCVSTSVGLLSQLDFAFSNPSQPIAAATVHAPVAPASSLYYPPIVL